MWGAGDAESEILHEEKGGGRGKEKIHTIKGTAPLYSDREHLPQKDKPPRPDVAAE